MNYLSNLYQVLALVMFVSGIMINYCTHLVPKSIVKLFRYGRANISKPGSTSGFLKRLEVPKSWFGHFYLYAVILQAVVVYNVFNKYKNLDVSRNWIARTLTTIEGSDRYTTVSSTTTILVTFLLLFHLCRRLLETWYVSIYSGTKMNILHYVLAFIHYTGAIFALIANSPGFSSDLSTPKDLLIDFNHFTLFHLIGVSLFLHGTYLQYYAHKGYADLRRGRDNTVTTFDHKIPRGGMFELVSCPNYWAEILIYCSFAIMLGFENRSWNFCTIWVISNQTIAGIMNHRWYQEKFAEVYPKSRKAIIPYIW